MMKEPIPTIVKLSLALLLFLCLLHLPYPAYANIRYICFFGFIYLCVYAAKQEDGTWLLTLLVPCVIFFQPFEKVLFSRTTWIVIDALLATGLVAWTLLAHRDYHRQRRG